MPGGRVKPVYFSETLGIQQAKAKAEAAHAAAEAVRLLAAEAQDQLRREALHQAQLHAENERAELERKQRDDDLRISRSKLEFVRAQEISMESCRNDQVLRSQLESKLAESNSKNAEVLQDDAENDLHASQMAALLAERAANPISITYPVQMPELDTAAIAAEMAALQVRIQNVLDTDIASAASGA